MYTDLNQKIFDLTLENQRLENELENVKAENAMLRAELFKYANSIVFKVKQALNQPTPLSLVPSPPKENE